MTEGRSNRAAYAAFQPIQTRWMDNDMYGHMNNVVHYSLFDTAVNAWQIAQGILDPMRGATVGLVVETGCRYFAEMGFPDLIHAGLRVARIGTSSVRFEVGLFRNDDDLAAAEGFFVHVFVDRETHRPVALDDRRRSAFAQLLIPPKNET